MKYLFTDQVLDRFTWRGTADLKAFEKLTSINALIYKGIRSRFKKYTFKEYQTYMVEWIKHSTTRQRTVVYQYPNKKQDEENEEFDEDLDEDFGCNN